MCTYKIEPEESKRLNMLKTLMCVFVLMIHAFSSSVGSQVMGVGIAFFLYQGTFVISGIVCDCAVPVFILISSVLLYAKPFDWRTNIKKKIRTLVVPYLIFNTFWAIVVYAKYIVGEKLGITAGDGIDLAAFSVYEWLNAYLGLGYESKPLLSVLWYVRDLFLLNLLAKPIQRLVDKFPIPVFILTAIVWLFDFPTYFLQRYSLPFFIAGYYLVKYNIHIQDFDRLNAKVVGLIYVVFLAVDVYLLRDTLVVHRLFILISIVMVIQLSKYAGRFDRIISRICPASFFLYLTHRFVYAVIQILLPNSLSVYLVAYFLKPVVALVAMTQMYYLMKRFTPKFLAVLTGGRLQ